MNLFFARFISFLALAFAMLGAPTALAQDSTPIVSCTMAEPDCICTKAGRCFLQKPVPIGELRTQKLALYFGSLNVTYGFSQFNDDCLLSGSNPNERQIVRTLPHVNMVMPISWGNTRTTEGRQNITDCNVKRLVEANSMGIERAVLDVSYILFDDTEHPFRYRGDEFVYAAIRAVFVQTAKNGVINMLRNGYCYVHDEPRLYGITEEDMRRAIEALRTVSAEFYELGECKPFSIFSPFDFTGGRYLSAAGVDDYSAGANVLKPGGADYALAQLLRGPEDPNPQERFLVPGGTFCEPIGPFVSTVLNDPKVKGMVSFIYFGGWKSTCPENLGIHGNGMAEKYCLGHKAIMHPDVAVHDCSTPPPRIELTVNGQKSVTVSASAEGDARNLRYWWSTTSPDGKESPVPATVTSSWRSSNPACSYGLNAGRWEAWTVSGSSVHPAMAEQAGCTYTITAVACNPRNKETGVLAGKECSASSITVTIVE